MSRVEQHPAVLSAPGGPPPPGPPRPPAPSPLGRLRVAATMFFALGGFVFAGWAVRIPALKEQTGASPRPLGLALLCMTGAAVATMPLTGRLCRRFDSRLVTIVAAALLSVGVVLPALTHSAVGLGLALLLFGSAYGAIDVAVNCVAVDLIAALRRPLMSSFHAANSLGSLAGAGLGALLAPHLSPVRHHLLLVPVGLAATAVFGRMLLRGAVPGTGTAATSPARGEARAGPRAGAWPAVAVFGVIGLCAAYCQGALDNWVPLHITEDLAGGEGVAAAGYAAVTLTLTVGRLTGVTLVERLGPTRVVVAGGLVAGAGTLVAALAPALPLVFAGLVATGLGLSNIFPMAMARAGEAGGPSGVAAAATLGYSGILLAPPTIGFLAAAFGLPVAMTTIAVLAAVAALVAGTAGRSRSVLEQRGEQQRAGA